MEHVLPIAPTLAVRDLAIVTAARFVQLVAYRIIYPIMPFLATTLAVDLQTVSLLITIQVAASLFSPLGGALAARAGQRVAMSAGLGCFIAGTSLCALSPSFATFLLGYGLIGLAGSLYHPAAQAYLSARTRYERRGRILGLYEFSWAAAALLGVAPLMVFVGQAKQPALAFGMLAVAGICVLPLIGLALPSTPVTAGRNERFDWRALQQPRVAALLVMLILLLFGIDLVFVVQGPWLNTSFTANEAAVGAVTALLGVAEVIGSLGSAALVDRVGKRRSVLLGYGLLLAAAIVLPVTSGNWLLFLPVFFVFDLGFEFGIVSTFPLASGIAPAMRNTVLSLCAAAVGIGRTFGSLLAEPLWRSYGIAANALLGASFVAVGLLLCIVLVREGEGQVS